MSTLPPRLSPQQRKHLFAMGFTGLAKPDIYDAIHFLLTEKKILIEASPTDSWNEWAYRVSAEDFMSPFFTALDSSRIDLFFKTKTDAELSAFDATVKWLLDSGEISFNSEED